MLCRVDMNSHYAFSTSHCSKSLWLIHWILLSVLREILWASPFDQQRSSSSESLNDLTIEKPSEHQGLIQTQEARLWAIFNHLVPSLCIGYKYIHKTPLTHAHSIPVCKVSVCKVYVLVFLYCGLSFPHLCENPKEEKHTAPNRGSSCW